MLTAPHSVQLVDFGKRKAVSTKKLDTKGHHGQPPDSRTACTRNGDRQAKSTDEAVQGRMARLDVSQELARYLLDLETRIWEL